MSPLAKVASSNLNTKLEIMLNNHEEVVYIPKPVFTTKSTCDTVTTGEAVGYESEGPHHQLRTQR